MINNIYKRLVGLEEKLVDSFGHLSTKPRWFTFWVIAYFLWIMIHVVFTHVFGWYTADLDTIIVVGLFSAFPYWVENSVKRSQAVAQEVLISTLHTLKELTESVQSQQTLMLAKDDTMLALVNRLIKIMEQKETKRGRPSE